MRVTLCTDFFLCMFSKIGLDPKADIFALYAQREAGITRNVIIDKTGKIVFLTRLYDEVEFKKMTEVIDELLK